MANTALMKTLVEPFVRQQLEREYGQSFRQLFLVLPSGDRHEFDAVSEDGTVVCPSSLIPDSRPAENDPAERSCPAMQSWTTCFRSPLARDCLFLLQTIMRWCTTT